MQMKHAFSMMGEIPDVNVSLQRAMVACESTTIDGQNSDWHRYMNGKMLEMGNWEKGGHHTHGDTKKMTLGV